ncbi:unnamed protein product [Cochlearia groenlandica]
MKKTTSAASKLAVKDEWVTAAMTEGQIVAELLIRLKHAETVVSNIPEANLTPLRWGIRQRRSRSSKFDGGGGVLVSSKKDLDSVRASPNTPLSWSDGSGSGGSASPSAANADGFEDISLGASCSASTGSRSKVFTTNEMKSNFSKRLKKRKSSSRLNEEENLKLKERLVLEKEIAISLQATYDKQHVRNKTLKRIKLDLNSSLVKNNETTVDKPQQHESKTCRGKENQGSFFFLPDLNMLPSEDDILYGTS